MTLSKDPIHSDSRSKRFSRIRRVGLFKILLFSLLILVGLQSFLVHQTWRKEQEAISEVRALGGLVAGESLCPEFLESWIPETITKFFDRMDFVSFESVSLTDEDLKCLSAFKSLQFIKIIDAEVTGRFLKYCPNPDKLEIVILRQTKFDESHAPLFSNMVNLESLDLGETAVTDFTLDYILELKNLAVLVLDGTQITDQGVAKLTSLPNLHHLDLRNTGVTDESVPAIASMAQLRIAVLDGSRMSIEALKRLGYSANALNAHDDMD